jgi:alkanesulfonate monooxygenase SsuD/methylene tetrahydromethanopterin reductase-like flavin-dependent oxidoreductase (luciferase family)
MKLGLQLNGFDWDGGPAVFGANLAEVARAAEEAGFDRIAVADHLWQHPIMGGPEADEPECYAGVPVAYLRVGSDLRPQAGRPGWRGRRA